MVFQWIGFVGKIWTGPWFFIIVTIIKSTTVLITVLFWPEQSLAHPPSSEKYFLLVAENHMGYEVNSSEFQLKNSWSNLGSHQQPKFSVSNNSDWKTWTVLCVFFHQNPNGNMQPCLSPTWCFTCQWEALFVGCAQFLSMKPIILFFYHQFLCLICLIFSNDMKTHVEFGVGYVCIFQDCKKKRIDWKKAHKRLTRPMSNLIKKKRNIMVFIRTDPPHPPDHCEYHSMLSDDATTRPHSQAVPNIAHGTQGWHPNCPNLDRIVVLKPTGWGPQDSVQLPYKWLKMVDITIATGGYTGL